MKANVVFGEAGSRPGSGDASRPTPGQRHQVSRELSITLAVRSVVHRRRI